MRKLLSLLAITGVVGSASTSVVSCKNALPQIGSLVFDDINIPSNIYAKSDNLLNQIYNKVAEFAALGDDAGAKIKDDEKIHFDFTYPDGKTTGMPSAEVPTQSGAYTVKIKVDDGDAYLASTKGAFVTYPINVTLDLNVATNFHPTVTAEETTVADVYKAISNDFATWADNESIHANLIDTGVDVTKLVGKEDDEGFVGKLLYSLYDNNIYKASTDTSQILAKDMYTIKVLASKGQYWVTRTTTDKTEKDPDDPSKDKVVEVGAISDAITINFEAAPSKM